MTIVINYLLPNHAIKSSSSSNLSRTDRSSKRASEGAIIYRKEKKRKRKRKRRRGMSNTAINLLGEI
jgi:hypothetical protein